jgi:hypothetical protein
MNKIKVKNIITGNRYYVYEHKINKEKHIPYIPKPIKLLPNDLTLTCSQCNSTQTYSTKYSYRRAMGIAGVGKYDKKENSGLCGKCRRSAKRKGWTLSEDDAKTRRLNAYNSYYKTNYTSVDDIPIDNKSYKRYRKKCQTISQTILKRERPDDYKLYINNKWDGTDLNLLSIDHIIPLHKCFRDRWTIDQACHISNLQLLTMKENIKKENPSAKKLL